MAFFPGMKLPAARKIALVRHTLTTLQKHWQVGPMLSHAQSLSPAPSFQSAIQNPQSAIS